MNNDRQIPTLRQFEALKYVYFMELTFKEAGERMGISQQAVSGLIQRLGEIAPELKGICKEKGGKLTTPRRFLTYLDSDSYDFEDSF